MPVRNALPYLDEAVESILAQTFGDFEFVIVDDCSRDGSRERLRAWSKKDRRITLHESDERLGPAGSANRVVEESGAPLIARMDADDVAHPERISRQVEIMLRHPEAVMTASTWEGIDRLGRVVREADISKLRSNGFGPPMAHGSIMFRRAAFLKSGGYRDECEYWEDLDFALRMAELGRVLVSAEPLYRHRFSETSTRLTSHRETVEDAVDFMFRCRDAYERGERRPSGTGADKTAGLCPQTFLSIGSVALWAGVRPGTLQRLLARGALRGDVGTLKALIWATWAEASPRSLRWLMRKLLQWRNRRSGIAATGTYEWRPRPGLRAPDSPSGPARK